jgi:hypothetical protein
MRLPLSALTGLTLLASFAQAQLIENVAPYATVQSRATAVSGSQLPPAPTVGSDACSTAEVLGSATGSFGFDLTTATTNAAEGQTSFTGGDCNYGCAEYGTGNVGVPGDVWFAWTAPASGRVRLSTCPVQQDTKIAVYNGPSCATGTSCVACSDDYHGATAGSAYARDSILYFDAIASAPYLIQIGRGFSLISGAGFTGTFTIEQAPLNWPVVPDVGPAEVSFSVGAANNGNVRMQRFGKATDVTTVTGADISWGWTGQAGLVNGTPCVVAIWDDPNDDGNPTDGVLLQQVASTYQNVSTGTFNTVSFSPAVTVNGAYFIGVASQLIACGTCGTLTTDSPLTADLTSCENQPDGAWYGVNTAAPYDVTNIPANSGPAFRIAQNCQAQGTATYNGLYHASWTIRSNVQAGPPPVGTAECFGDTAALCPCSGAGGSGIPNPGATGNGCANSSFPAGANLSATGVAVDNAGDTVVLTCTSMPGPGLFFQSNGLVGPILNFNDGTLCAAAGIIRMGVVFPTAGTASYPGGLTPNPVHVAGAPVLLGGSPTAPTKHYQCWYRDITVGFCNSPGHNMSNGVAIVWAP